MSLNHMLSGWWGQIAQREGWSADISKSEWLVLQFTIGFTGTIVFGLAALAIFDLFATQDATTTQNVSYLAILAIIVPLVFTLFNHDRWDADQLVLRGEPGQPADGWLVAGVAVAVIAAVVGASGVLAAFDVPRFWAAVLIWPPAIITIAWVGRNVRDARLMRAPSNAPEKH